MKENINWDKLAEDLDRKIERLSRPSYEEDEHSHRSEQYEQERLKNEN